MKLSPKARRERAAKREAVKRAAIWKHRRHVIFYTLLGAAILSAQIFIPEAVDLAVDGAHTLFEVLLRLAKTGTTSILAFIGFVYTVKELWQAFNK